MSKTNYSSSGVNYDLLDPIKKLAQTAAKSTGRNLKTNGASEISDTRGESAFVWKQGTAYMASVIEGLGTKNLVADAMHKITGKSYYQVIGHDTVAAIINDLVSVGATPLTIFAYWAVGNSEWFKDEQRATDLISGWKKGCDEAGATWGGGETPSCSGIINPETIDLGGSAVGIIKRAKHLLSDKKLHVGDRIILLKSNGINTNGLSLARKLAEQLPQGYATKLPGGQMYGEALLTSTNIYAQLIQKLLTAGVELHYISNITGHGLRKLIRGRPNFSYVIEQLLKPQEIFSFIQATGNLSDYDMHETFNMGQDYALYLPAKEVAKAQKIIKKCGFGSIDAGYLKKGEKQIMIDGKNIVYTGNSMNLR